MIRPRDNMWKSSLKSCLITAKRSEYFKIRFNALINSSFGKIVGLFISRYDLMRGNPDKLTHIDASPASSKHALIRGIR